MRVTVMQPTYWPPLHYFQRVLGTDVFVVLDNAQYVRKGWQNECWLRDRGGHKVTFRVPVRHIGTRCAINESQIDETEPWRRKHLKGFETVLAKAPRWEELVQPMVRDVLEGFSEFFGNLALATVTLPLAHLGYAGKVELASGLAVEGKASGWMLELCRHFGATEYVCGQPAFDNYLDKSAFVQAGVRLIVQDWACPPYAQRGMGFVENLSILDLLANVGAEGAREVLA